MYFCGYVVEIYKGNIVHDCLAELYVYTLSVCVCVEGGVVGVSTRLRVGRSRLRVPARVEEFSVPCNAQTCSGAQPVVHFNECCVLFRGVKPPLVELSTHFFVVLMLRMCGVVPLLPVFSLHGVGLDDFTLYVYPRTCGSSKTPLRDPQICILW
jgi:hypothetical protein